MGRGVAPGAPGAAPDRDVETQLTPPRCGACATVRPSQRSPAQYAPFGRERSGMKYEDL